MTQLPDELEYGFVRSRILLAVADTPADEDHYPDAQAAQGTVRFTPSRSVIRGTEEPVFVIKRNIEVGIAEDADTAAEIRKGDLIHNDRPGVWLVTGIYTVRFQLGDVSIEPFQIHVTPDHTEATPLWLSLAAPHQPTPDVKFVVNEQVYLDTLAASETAQAAADRVDEITQGPAGESAYEVAVSEGFIGTKAEWLESLKGEDGDGGAGTIQTLSGSGGTITLSDGGGSYAIPEGDAESAGLMPAGTTSLVEALTSIINTRNRRAEPYSLAERDGDGGTAFSHVTLTDTPTEGDHAASKQYVDESAAKLLGGQVDFVEMGQKRSPYNRLTVTRNPDGTTEATCHADDGHGITYTLTGGDQYRLVGTITEHGEGGGLYTPDTQERLTVEDGDRRVANGDFTTGGTWSTSSTWYTTEVGATWETTITTTQPDTHVFMSLYCDDRGGIWEVELVEDSSVSALVTTHRSSAGTVAGIRVLAVPTPGTYTLRGTFVGEDPNNPLASGSPRGWLAGNDEGYTARLATLTGGRVTLSPGASNKNWALRVRHPDAGEEEFFPAHGTDVETIVEPPAFYDGTRALDLAAGGTVDVGSLSIVQRIRCHISASSDDLIEVYTTDTITPDGTYRTGGRIEVLHDLISTHQMYTAMLPFNPAELNQVVTSFRNSYPAGPDMAGPSTRLGEEGLHTTSVAVVGDDPNVMAAVRFDVPEETRRMSQNENINDSWHTPMFIEHRSEGLGKVYPRFGYLNGTPISAGTVWRFTAEYWFGRIPGIRHLIE